MIKKIVYLNIIKRTTFQLMWDDSFNWSETFTFVSKMISFVFVLTVFLSFFFLLTRTNSSFQLGSRRSRQLESETGCN